VNERKVFLRASSSEGHAPAGMTYDARTAAEYAARVDAAFRPESAQYDVETPEQRALEAQGWQLTALHAAYTECQSTGDLQEFARAVGNILGATDE
jgi:hypothetical protein